MCKSFDEDNSVMYQNKKNHKYNTICDLILVKIFVVIYIVYDKIILSLTRNKKDIKHSSLMAKGMYKTKVGKLLFLPFNLSLAQITRKVII